MPSDDLARPSGEVKLAYARADLIHVDTMRTHRVEPFSARRIEPVRLRHPTHGQAWAGVPGPCEDHIRGVREPEGRTGAA